MTDHAANIRAWLSIWDCEIEYIDHGKELLETAAAHITELEAKLAALRAWEIGQRVDHSQHFTEDGESCGEGVTWKTREGRDVAAILAQSDTPTEEAKR